MKQEKRSGMSVEAEVEVDVPPELVRMVALFCASVTVVNKAMSEAQVLERAEAFRKYIDFGAMR